VFEKLTKEERRKDGGAKGKKRILGPGWGSKVRRGEPRKAGSLETLSKGGGTREERESRKIRQ